MEKAVTLSRPDTRKYGIDILKMLSMFMVLILHILRRGGLLGAVEPGTSQWYTVWALETLSYCAVNCFALCSGYLMIDKKFRSARIIDLWCEVLFYSLTLTIVQKLFFAEEFPSDGTLWIKTFFPAATNFYWYFSCYFSLMFFIPFLNILAANLNRRQYTLLVVAILALFSGVSTFSPADPFATGNGYSFLWLASLYLVGGYFKTYNIGASIKKRWYALGYLLSNALTLLCLAAVKVDWFPYSIKKLYPTINRTLLYYISPTIVLAAVCLFLLFLNLNLKGKALKKTLAFLSPLSFSVYIVHSHPLFSAKFMNGKSIEWLSYSPLEIIGLVLLSGIAIYTACSVYGFLRSIIFKHLKINKLIAKLGNKIDSALMKDES